MARLIAACKYLGLRPPEESTTSKPDPGDVIIVIAEKLQQLEANKD